MEAVVVVEVAVAAADVVDVHDRDRHNPLSLFTHLSECNGPIFV